MVRIAVRHLLNRRWQTVLIAVAVLAAVFVVYFWKLGSLTPGFSDSEIKARTASSSIGNLIANPINLPHKLPQYIFQATGHKGPTAMRMVSVVFALMAAMSFFIVIKWWFDRRMAILATAALVTTPLFIIAARSATPDILWACGLSVIIAAYLWVLTAETTKNASLLSFTAIIALCLYIPGLVWPLTVGMLFFSHIIWYRAKLQHRLLPYGLLLLIAALLSPLIYGIINHPTIARELLLLPNSFSSFSEIIQNIAWMFLGIFWRTHHNMPETLGHLPLLSVFSSVVIFFGIVYIISQYKRRRSYVLLVIISLTILIAGLQNNILVLLLCLPALFILFGGGLAYLFKEWFGIFPRNPFARALAVGLIVAALSVHVIYGIRYSLVAWPQAPETKQAYMLK